MRSIRGRSTRLRHRCRRGAAARPWPPAAAARRRRRRRRGERRPGGSRRRHHAHAVDPRPAGEAGQPAGRGVQREPPEPGRAHRRPQRRLRRQGRRRGRLRRPAGPVRRRHRLRAELGAAGSVPGHHREHRRPPVQGHHQQGPPDGRHRTRARSYVLPFVLDLSMLFWNKDLFHEAGLDPEKAPATLEEFAAAAKAIQALGKPDTYGTATGLNCGGCLVFTWFPCIWAAGDQVMNPDGTRVAARVAHRDARSTTPGGTCGRPAPCCPRRRTRPARPGPRASPRARSA